MVSHPALTNQAIAAVLRELGERLQHTGDSPFRVAAYRRAATTISMYPREVAEIVAQEGEAGLRRLPGIGKSLARTIARLLRQGHSVKLERLRQRSQGQPLLCSVPGVGTKLAERLQQTLGANSLEEVFAAACDGRLRRVPGLGTKRVRSIRESLAARLQAGALLPPSNPLQEPPIAELLSIDQEYLELAAAGRLPLSAPRLFNPTGGRWLPILRTQRGNRLFVAHFANTARSHQLGRFRDWVVITCETKQDYGQWTMITATRGSLRDKRIVMHREQECREHYDNLRVQKSLPLEDGTSSTSQLTDSHRLA